MTLALNCLATNLLDLDINENPVKLRVTRVVLGSLTIYKEVVPLLMKMSLELDLVYSNPKLVATLSM